MYSLCVFSMTENGLASPPTIASRCARCREGAQKESLSHDSFLRDLGHKRGGLGRIFGRVKNDNSTSKSGQKYIYWFEQGDEPMVNHEVWNHWVVNHCCGQHGRSGDSLACRY